jgi:UDP-glucuronate decarboxylase
MTKRLLITGGTGFFGRALLRNLLAEAECSPSGTPSNYMKIYVISRDPERFFNRYRSLASAPWLFGLRADVLQRQTLDTLLGGEKVDSVIHAATDSTDAAALSPTQRLNQIVEGTRNVLDLAIRLKARRFLLTSSGGVYGPQPSDMSQIPETYCGLPDPLLSTSTYGVGKRMAEHLCFLYQQQHGIETVIARCFAFVGQDLPLDAHFAIGNFIRDALHRPTIEVAGDGSPIRTYMDQRDLSRWLVSLLEHGQPGEAYNVGSDVEITIRDLARLVRDNLAPHKSVNIRGAVIAQSHRSRYVPSIRKALEALDLRLIYSLEDAILECSKQISN